jgi:hypothetical protein
MWRTAALHQRVDAFYVATGGPVLIGFIGTSSCPYGCPRTTFPAEMDATRTYRTQKGAPGLLRS